MTNETSVTGRKTFADDVLNYKSPACPNPVHPKGRWHEAAPLPPSWDFVERASQWFNRARWGCSCHAVPNLPPSEYWKVAASFLVIMTVWAMIVFGGLSYVVSVDDVEYWRGTAAYRNIDRGPKSYNIIKNANGDYTLAPGAKEGRLVVQIGKRGGK